jgi:hypothetical protein
LFVFSNAEKSVFNFQIVNLANLFLEDDLLQREAAKFVHYIIMVVMTACAKIIMSILGLDKSLSIVYALKQFLHDSR